MARVTLTLEDRVKDGVDGLRVSLTSDPDFSDSEEQTIAQDFGVQLVNLILDNCSEVQEVEQSNDPDISLN